MYLTLLLTVPFAAGILLLAVPSLRRAAFLLSLAPLLILLAGREQWTEASIHQPWFSYLSINFSFAVDALSLLFLYLTAIVTPFALLAQPQEVSPRHHLFCALVLFLQGLLIGFFTARDLVVFTVFWEAMLLPLFFVIAFWGREQAAYKFLLYMVAGSALMVLGVLAFYFGTGSFDLRHPAALPYAIPVFAIFCLAFAVKTPLFPFHGWLPDVYTQAPFAGSILLSAILSKGGVYGFARIGLEVFPEQFQLFAPYLLALAIIGVLWGGLAAWVQTDYKRLVAYSSFSHVNFILAGLFAFGLISIMGALLQAFNHGVTITALFLVAGWLAERSGSTSLEQGGLAKFMPRLCWLTLFFVLAAIALPGTGTFVGELLILYGLFLNHPYLAFFLGCSVILSAMYMLRWMQKSYFGPPGFFKEEWKDIAVPQLIVATPLIALILWIGIYPAPMIRLSEKAAVSVKEKV